MSSKVYCIAQFKPKPGKEEAVFKALQDLEPNAQREDACIQYTVTRKIDNPFADGSSYPIVFHEIWADRASFEAHCQRREIQAFFADNGIELEPIRIALWGIPTAICAFVIHSWRIHGLERAIARRAARDAEDRASKQAASGEGTP